MSEVILQASHINKSFHDPVTIPVLNDVSMSVNKGEFVSVVGRSGCGKSTLLYVLSTMDTDYEGQLWIDQQLVTNQKEKQLARIRNEKIGFVFQFHYLLNEFSVLRNVMLPGLKLNRYSEQETEHRAMERLKMLHIDELALKNANQLSGGQKQRVAIARALINDPAIIMGDEPTGNLDKKNGQLVFDIFRELSLQYQQTLLIVTHDPEFAGNTNRIIEMEDGRIIRQ
ncbi:lipoprotein-releasing system ATP-binding protein [Chitinophaga ginsengisegetis]|uniref:Lipoprotein-releasing system ATP-binding protein n=1 Tax=Chitinophaga ginsengisegetis TaxID=393003 RepID=A0A1T5P8I5_9BACT|nr:ABC transporter ATP-binding protein [Chitinophaga ginsengisegetis]MDR6567933.1 lipoprotein-releasing system ATP-binding protein [Chitinophaga ginsengisegetis]MDR6647512.1 lipoprotein-releasing system ATP-binding protein [Chitinophaga ginsengisegetis]MDR6653862.1 lipoprotein-releasing system ATP-binding protein [Chitinophaga ginsengisegetis]SKD08883.1 lipoprotein-releasing system ATP-binding protein [Chitinophaga ginsengisegetis]